LPLPLDYSTPRCFFEREYRYRSWGGAGGCLVLLGSAGFATLMARWVPASSDLPFRVAHVMLWAITAACAVAAGWLLFNLMRNTVELVRITEEGIEQNRRLYPWGRVSSLGGTAVVGGILLEFRTKAAPFPELFRALMTTPPLKREEFDALLAVLADYLASEHPHVQVNPVPRTAA
jgi:hypothetical protein